MTGEDILSMKAYLVANCLQYDDAIHVRVAERKTGKQFSFEEHIAALVYAQLTNQTKWSRIVPHLSEIDKLFFYYDPQEIKNHPGSYFADGIFALKCGNISTKAQMNSLHKNITTMEKIANEYGSMDAFVTSVAPLQVVELLSSGKSKYKLAMLGEALAWEYIRNVGIDGCKPDTHLRRFLTKICYWCSIAIASGNLLFIIQNCCRTIGCHRMNVQSTLQGLIWIRCGKTL